MISWATLIGQFCERLLLSMELEPGLLDGFTPSKLIVQRNS